MSDSLDETLVRALTRALAPVKPADLERWLAVVLPEADVGDPSARSAAARIVAEPTWVRGAVRSLDAHARAGLRLLARAPSGLRQAELEALVALLVPDAKSLPPACAQLLDSGLVLRDDAALVHYGMPTPWLSLLAPLAPACLTLTDTARPPALPDAAEALADADALFRLGVTLAVVEHERPRSTRVSDMHRADERKLSQLLAPLHGGEDRALTALRRLSRNAFLHGRSERLAPDYERLARLEDPVGEITLQALATRAHDLGTLAVVGLLLEEERPRTLAEIIETLCALSPRSDARLALEVPGRLETLAAVPGITVGGDGASRTLRATAVLRRVLRGDPPPPFEEPRLLVQANLQIVAPLGTRLETLLFLGRIARLVSADRVAVFALEADAVRRAVQDGLPVTELLGTLERRASHGVPATVARALSDWGRTRGTVRVEVGTFLFSELSPPALQEAVGRERTVTAIAPGVYRISGDAQDGRLVAANLHRAGFSVTGNVEQAPTPTGAGRQAPPAPFEKRASGLGEAARKALESTRPRRAPGGSAR